MEFNKYYTQDLETGSKVYYAKNEDVQIQVYTNGYFSFSHWVNSDKFFEEEGCTEITRTEFMEAYLPIAEKMNNKIGEL